MTTTIHHVPGGTATFTCRRPAPRPRPRPRDARFAGWRPEMELAG